MQEQHILVYNQTPNTLTLIDGTPKETDDESICPPHTLLKNYFTYSNVEKERLLRLNAGGPRTPREPLSPCSRDG